MRKEPLNRPLKSYEQIRADWEKIQRLDIKNRYKAMRTIANDILEINKTPVSNIEQLEFYIQVLKPIMRIHQSSQSTRLLSKMIINWLELTGNDKATIIKKKAGKIPVAKSISICDIQNSEAVKQAFDNYSEQNLLTVINGGKALIFHSLIHDEAYNIHVRIVDSLEPVLTSKEFKCVEDATETVIINLPTGTLSIADPWNLENEKERLSINVDPGHYKVCAYLFYIPNKIESYYIVLCKTSDAASNTLTRISDIEITHF